MRPWTGWLEIKCFHKGRKQWRQDKLTEGSIKTLMTMAWVKIQTPKKITYSEEETSRQGAAGCKMGFEFAKEVTGGIKQKPSVPFLRHAMQQAIILGKEHGLDTGYSEVKIRHWKYRVDVKFLKYSGLHPIPGGYEENLEEEMEGFIFG